MSKLLTMILSILVIQYSNAQPIRILNSCHYPSSDVIFSNSVVAGLTNKILLISEYQSLYSVSNNIRYYSVGFSYPLTLKTHFGLYSSILSTGAFTNGQYSAFVSRNIYKQYLWMGVQVNVLNRSYNISKFGDGFDFGDPILDNSSVVSFSGDIAFYSEPISGLQAGATLKHINQPDISASKIGISQPRAFQLGMCFKNIYAIPQLEYYSESGRNLWQIGARKSLLNNHLDIFLGFNRNDKGDIGFFAQVFLQVQRNINIAYQVLQSLGESAVLGGVKLASLTVSMDKEEIGLKPSPQQKPPPPTPEEPYIVFRSSQYLTTTQDTFRLQVIVYDRIQLTKVDVVHNSENIMSTSNIERDSLKIVLDLELIEGENVIVIRAENIYRLAVQDTAYIIFEKPSKPEIVFQSERKMLTDNRVYPLGVIVRDKYKLDQAEVFQNEIKIDSLNSINDDAIYITRDIQLKEGVNFIVVRVENSHGLFATDTASVTYSRTDQLLKPFVRINSPAYPLAKLPEIEIRFEIENAHLVDRLLLKVNGIVIDTLQIMQTRSPISDIYSGKTAVNISPGNNQIEAFAYTHNRSIADYKTLSVLYNPCADRMKYENKVAFVVGINKYTKRRLRPLREAVNDAEKIAAFFQNELGFSKVFKLIDEQAIKENIEAVILDSLSQLGSADLLACYFAVHAVDYTSASGEPIAYIIPFDGDLPEKRRKPNISMDYINTELDRCPARDVVIFYDNCFAAIGVTVPPPISYNAQSENINYDALCNKAIEKSRFVISAGENESIDGLFARILIEGLSGKADINPKDMWISASEIGTYLQRIVPLEAKRLCEVYHRSAIDQTPFWGERLQRGGEGVFMIPKKRMMDK